MKKITIFTMQLKTPGGIERFITTLATILSKDYTVEIVANYGKPTDHLAFPLPMNIKLTFLTPVQPSEISMKHLITHFKWHHIPSETRRRFHINRIRNLAFQKYLINLNTDYIITDRALYNSLITKYYHGNAVKIATDHNHHQNNHKYITELLSSIQNYDYLILATKELRDFYTPKTHVKCVYVPNPLSSIPAKKSPLTTKNLISIGRLVPEKDFTTLINAMQLVHQQDPEIHLTIIGDGTEHETLKSQINSLNLKDVVTMTGWLPQSQIANYYYDSSLYVCTSRTEAFGLVLAEAMSYGLPCLALARASGARAQITKDTGFLLNTSDPTIIADKITELLNHKDQLRSLQPHINQEIKDRYSPEVVKVKWRQLLAP